MTDKNHLLDDSQAGDAGSAPDDSLLNVGKKTGVTKRAMYWLPSLRVQLFMILIVLALSPVLVLGRLVGEGIAERLEEQTRQNTSDWLSWLGEDIRTHIDKLRSDTIIATNYPPVEGLIRAIDNGDIDPLDGSTSEDWRHRLEHLFAAYCENSDALQVRYLNETGREWVRVDKDGTGVRVVPEEELQDKSTRYYFEEAMKLKAGQCYVSPMDLNVEFGIVTNPHTPMLRVSTPVWHEGRRRGVIVINQSPVALFARIESAHKGRLVLADKAGTYLYHADESKRWGNQLGGNANLYSDWRGIKEIERNAGSIFEEEERVFAWSTILVNADDPRNTWLLGSEWDRADFYRATSGVKRIITMGSIGLGALVTLLALLLAYVWVRPLSMLAVAAGRVREGDFSVRVPARRGDELGDLSRAFNLMAEEVGSRAAALEEAKIEAEQASTAKSVFLASMSHELRTPLNVILGFTQILGRDEDLSDEKKENLATIGRCGEHLLELINEILEISKIEAGQNTLNPVNVSLRLMMKDVEGMMRPRALEKNLSLTFTVDESFPDHVKLDSGRLRQVLINLIGNAVKFTSKGSIRVSASGRSDSDRQFVRFEVTDTGCGIREDQMGHLFEAFVQLNPEKMHNEGAGLGLAISERFVRMLGGELRVDSAPGQGSTFAFEIPAEISTGDEVRHFTPRRKIAGLKAGSPRYRILIVEDNRLNGQILQKMLEPLDMQCKIADDGEEGVRMWESWKPDLIFMDIRMPVMDGYEATRIIRANPDGKRVPIIAVSASVFDHERESIFAEGCDDFIPKPLDENELYRKLKEHLGLDFVYAEDEHSATSVAIHDGGHALSLESVSGDLVEQLESALLDVDPDKMSAIIEAIGGSEPAIASHLKALVGNYKYDYILNCVDKSRSVG